MKWQNHLHGYQAVAALKVRLRKHSTRGGRQHLHGYQAVAALKAHPPVRPVLRRAHLHGYQAVAALKGGQRLGQHPRARDGISTAIRPWPH